jgi:hypothetical protein
VLKTGTQFGPIKEGTLKRQKRNIIKKYLKMLGKIKRIMRHPGTCKLRERRRELPFEVVAMGEEPSTRNLIGGSTENSKQRLRGKIA